MKNSQGRLSICFIDFDAITNPLLSGGQARATYEVARRLGRMGHTVTILCSRYPSAKDQVIDGISYRHIGFGSKNLPLNNVFFFLSLPFALQKLRADVIIECFMAPVSTSFAPLFTKIPVIGMPTMFEAEQFTKKYHFPFHWIEKAGCKLYRYFLAYSMHNKQKMEKYNAKIYTRIIPNGVSEEFFTIKSSPGNYIFFIGRIDFFQKGLDILLDACEKIRDKKKLRLIIAGNGSVAEEKRLREEIIKRKLTKYVEFIGRVDGKKKEELISHSLCGIYPSRFEDFPLVPLEFASMGKQLICFDIPGLSFVSAEVAIKAKPFVVEQLAVSIERVLRQPTKNKSMQQKCRRFAKRYGWNGIANQYAEFCQQVITMETLRKQEVLL